MAKIDADRSDRGRITQSNSDCIGVVAYQAVKVDRAVDVTSVVEDDSAERLHDSEWKAHFGVQNQQLPATHGDGNVYAASLGFQNIAERDQSLRAGLVDWKSTQRRSATRKIKLAGGNKTSGKGFCEA